jgi:hypothetical protein
VKEIPQEDESLTAGLLLSSAAERLVATLARGRAVMGMRMEVVLDRGRTCSVQIPDRGTGPDAPDVSVYNYWFNIRNIPFPSSHSLSV